MMLMSLGRKEKEGFPGHVCSKLLCLVSFCVAPARGTRRSVRIEDRGELVDKGSLHCGLCPGEIMALNLLK